MYRCVYTCIVLLHCRYLGIAFGLANVWHFVNDAGTKALTQEVAESILDDLIKEHFWIVSPEGSVGVGHGVQFIFLYSLALWLETCDIGC